MRILLLIFLIPLSAFSFGGSPAIDGVASETTEYFTGSDSLIRTQANFSHVSEEELLANKKIFQDTFLKKDPSLNTLIDWEVLWQMNIRASRIWQNILICSAGDNELARRHYFDGKSFCKSESESTNIFSELVTLHQELRQFVQTTQISENRNWNFFEKKRLDELLAIHPLLAQVFLEQLATIVKFHDDWQGHDQYHSPSIDPGYHYSFYENVQNVVTNKMNDKKFATAREYWFSHLLLKFLPLPSEYEYAKEARSMNTCDQWGLWPEATEYFTFLVSIQNSTAVQYKSIYEEIEHFQCNNNSYSGYRIKDPGLPLVYRELAKKYGMDTKQKTLCSITPHSLANVCFSVDPEDPHDVR